MQYYNFLIWTPLSNILSNAKFKKKMVYTDKFKFSVHYIKATKTNKTKSSDCRSSPVKYTAHEFLHTGSSV